MSAYDYNLMAQRFCRDYGLSDVAKKQLISMLEEHDQVERKARIDELKRLLSTVDKEFMGLYRGHINEIQDWLEIRISDLEDNK